MRRSVLTTALVLASACASVACDETVEPTKAAATSDAGTDATTTPPGDSGTPDGGGTTDAGDGGTGPIEFTDYVKDLILTKTADNNTPDDPETKTFKDSEDPAAFPTSFF